MSDYGFKIAQTGYDVKTALDSQLAITSKMNSQKIQPSLQGSITITIPANSDYTITITHNLGYIPSFDGWHQDELGIWHSIFDETALGLQGNPNIYAPTGDNQYATTSVIHYLLHNRELPGGASHTVNLYYIIFLDSIV